MFLVFMPPSCTSEMDSTPPATADGRALGHHLLRAHRDGLQARRAEAVDGGAGRRHRTAGLDGREPRDVEAGGAFRIGAAHEDVLDLGRIDAGLADGVLDGVARHDRAVRHVESAACGLRQSGPRGGNDHRFTHLIPPQYRFGRTLSRRTQTRKPILRQHDLARYPGAGAACAGAAAAGAAPCCWICAYIDHRCAVFTSA